MGAKKKPDAPKAAKPKEGDVEDVSLDVFWKNYSRKCKEYA